jgi:hypothetical protein
VILLLELHIDRIRNRKRVLQNIRPAREVSGNLIRRLEVQTTVVLHAIRIFALLVETNAEQHIVGVVIV